MPFQQRRQWRRTLWMQLPPLPLLLTLAVGCVGSCPSLLSAAAVGYGVPLELDRSFIFRFECPPAHADRFAVTYLPRVWRHVNASLDRLLAGHGLSRCSLDPVAAASRPLHSCLIVNGARHDAAQVPGESARRNSGRHWFPAGGSPEMTEVTRVTVYEISVQLHGRAGQAPLAAERAAFASEAARARADIEALDGIHDCANINVTAWARGGDGGGNNGGCQSGVGPDCKSPATEQSAGSAAAAAIAAVIVAAALSVALVSAILLARLRRLRRQPSQQQPLPLSADDDDKAADGDRKPPQLRGPRRRPRQSVSASADISLAIVVGRPADGLGWLNLAYRPDERPLPSRVTRFRGGEPAAFVDEGEAARQFARLSRGSSVGDSGDFFYRLSETFVLASTAACDASSTERLLDLLWSCGGVAVSVDPCVDLAERLQSLTAGGGGRFHVTGWEAARSFPCYRLTTATMHCLDTNLSKRLRLCQFTGRWDPAGDAPASRAEFVRFAIACADSLLAVATAAAPAPAAALGSGLSSASLLPTFLTAAEQLRRGGNGSCDLLRLTAEMRRQCPGAVASLQHYLFLTHCLHAYAFLLKRNSI